MKSRLTPRASLHTETGRIIVLNGFPGTGKLTILKRLRQLLPPNTCLLDNHLLIDPVAAIFPDRNDEHHELRRLVRAPIFEALRKRAKEGHAVLLTACLAQDSPIDTAFLEEHLDMVRGTNTTLHWINVHCDPATLEERLTSPERFSGSKTKLTATNILRVMLQDHRLIQPPEGLRNVFIGSVDVSGSVDSSVELLIAMVGNTRYSVPQGEDDEGPTVAGNQDR